MIVEIASSDDPRIEPFRAVRERDLAGRDGLCVLEGRVVLEKAAARAPGLIRSMLIARHKLPGLADVVASLPSDCVVMTADGEIMDRIAGFPIHRGVLAMARRPERRAEDLLAGAPSLVVGLVGVANHDNMGGVFRNAAAFGAGAVLLDETSCDPLYRKAIRVSVGAAITLPFARAGTAAEILGLLKGRGYEILALTPAGRESLRNVARAPRIAVLFGAEGPGLPDDVLSAVRTVALPMAGGFDSLNLATTSGIVLHHLAS